jgi:hypothetical protein
VVTGTTGAADGAAGAAGACDQTAGPAHPNTTARGRSRLRHQFTRLWKEWLRLVLKPAGFRYLLTICYKPIQKGVSALRQGPRFIITEQNRNLR